MATIANPIVLENENPGTPQSIWQVAPGQDSAELQGFTTSISTNIGGQVDFKINNLTGNGTYEIDIYRLGYYGGDGARLVGTVQHPSSTSVLQPAPITDATTGLVDAGNWQVTDSWQVPTGAVSGVYVANVVQGNQVFQIPFIIRNTSSTSDIVLQTDDETWQAYNGWGGANLYGGNGPAPPSAGGFGAGAAYAVSYNRPITTLDGSGFASGPQDTVFGAEYSAIYWLEENGYDVSYISGVDAATDGSLLLNHKVFLDVGHDEYWTDSQLANVKAAEQAGINLAFLSGNEIFWQTRFAPSIDGRATANRTLISYKDSHFRKVIDPNGIGTGSFEAPANMGGAGTPSNVLTGTSFQVDQTSLGPISVPYGETQLRFWRNTAVAQTAPGQSATLAADLLGYEWDSAPDNGFRPPGLVSLSSTTVNEPTAFNTDFGNVDTAGTATHSLVEYRDPVSGALVFGAGTVFWAWGLAQQSVSTAYRPLAPDPSVQQATVNLLADMGALPGTLQPNLTPASQSTDHTAPSSQITGMSTRNPVEGQLVTATGSATDSGGLIADVDVSIDGGTTWHPASAQIGTASGTWSYTFAAPAPGSYTIESRAVDDSLNIETPVAGLSYVVQPSSNSSLFSGQDAPSTVDANDGHALELGVKFTTTATGTITGIRFYKGPQDIGTHVVNLWSAAGALLATASSTSETSSGWQQVNFSTPVQIAAGTNYIASYFSSSGDYSFTPYFFDTLQGFGHGSLHATGNGLNGLFSYSSGSTFPSSPSPFGSNYWVDVAFDDTSGQPVQAIDDSGFVTSENQELAISASALLANDIDSSGAALAVAGVSNPSHGTVAYDSSSQTITFAPTAGYTGPAGFDYAVTDGQNTASASVSLVVNPPITAQTLFDSGSTPKVANVTDPNSVELGVKFQASQNGTITGIRFYKGPQNTGSHIGDLWTAGGTLLASVTFSNETTSGWQEADFATPVAVTAGTTYVASYHTSGNYAVDTNYFATAHSNGELTAPASAASSGNGVYAYGTGPIFPTSTFQADNYWVDLVFDGQQGLAANNDAGFLATTNTTLSIPGSALLANDTDSGGGPLSISGVGNPSNGTVSYDPNAQSILFTPAAGYTGPAGFSYSITDPQGGTAAATVALTVNDATLFGAGATPSIVSVNDPNPVELGIKFAASEGGAITGIRFYKGPQNTGTHVADLWTDTGTLLASASFGNETANGWQEVDFASPVSITAGMTYVAAYHTNGNYSADPGLLASAIDNGPLMAPPSSVSGGNGVYAYGSGRLFPTDTFNATSYGVDVLFRPQPIA